MPRLTKIYTRTGDQREIALIMGPRVPKDCLRVRALGTIDELNAHLGMAASMGLTPMLAALPLEMQRDLLNPGSDLVVPGSDHIRLPIPSVDATQVQLLQSIVDSPYEELAPPGDFVLPGGTPVSALPHIARTICRRAEREVVALARRGRRRACPALPQSAVGCGVRHGATRTTAGALKRRSGKCHPLGDTGRSRVWGR